MSQKAASQIAPRARKLMYAVATAGVEVVDARPILRQAANKGYVFLATDTHRSPRGAGNVAEEVALRVRRYAVVRVAADGPPVWYEVPAPGWDIRNGSQAMTLNQQKIAATADGPPQP